MLGNLWNITRKLLRPFGYLVNNPVVRIFTNSRLVISLVKIVTAAHLYRVLIGLPLKIKLWLVLEGQFQVVLGIIPSAALAFLGVALLTVGVGEGVERTYTAEAIEITLAEGGSVALDVEPDTRMSHDVILALEGLAGTANTNDYTFDSREILVGAGSVTSSVALLTIVDDSDEERDESFGLRLTSKTDGVRIDEFTITVRILASDGSLNSEVGEHATVTVSLLTSQVSGGQNAFSTTALFGFIQTALSWVGIELNFTGAALISLGLTLLGIVLVIVKYIFVDLTFHRYGIERSKYGYRGIFETSWLFILSQRVGRMHQFAGGQVRAPLGVGLTFTNFVASLVEMVLYVGTALVLVWELVAFVVVLQVLNSLVQTVFIKISQQIARESVKINLALGSTSINAIGSIKTVKSSATHFNILNRIFGLLDKSHKLGVRSGILGQIRGGYNRILNFVTLLGSMVLGIFILGLDATTLLLFVIVVPQLFARYNAFFNNISGLVNSIPTLEVLNEFVDEMEAGRERSDGEKIDRIRSSLKFRGTNFTYPRRYVDDYEFFAERAEKEKGHGMVERQANVTIDSIDLEIKPNTMVSLVGPSGAGKTTILDLVTGILPPDNEGSITIDGRPLSDYDIISWRKSLSYLPQQAFLFSDTIRNNFLLFSAAATDRDLDEVCRKVRMYDFIQALPDKYDTAVGERGIQLSGGQAQRLAIARALLSKPKFLIMDEATSNLDVDTERAITDYIISLKKSTTILMSAHRIVTALHSDKIYFIEDGRVAESGSPRELIKLKGKFYAYWSQYAMPEDPLSDIRDDKSEK